MALVFLFESHFQVLGIRVLQGLFSFQLFLLCDRILSLMLLMLISIMLQEHIFLGGQSHAMIWLVFFRTHVGLTTFIRLHAQLKRVTLKIQIWHLIEIQPLIRPHLQLAYYFTH